MAEPGATTLPPTAAPARDILLATKLHIPRPRPGFLSRPRLLGLVGDGATRELTLVCAPAGFGKTTLLGDWARRSRRPVAWLSLDQGDNDPARFWRYVAAALDQAQPGTGERMAALLRGGAGPTRRCPWPRSGPRGQLAELRATALRFRPAEAAALLREVADADLPEASVRALVTCTEVWAAGLQLAALSLHDRARTLLPGPARPLRPRRRRRRVLVHLRRLRAPSPPR